MLRILTILVLLVTLNAVAEPTAYMDMVLRARNAAEARERLGVTNGVSGGSSNGQPASLNLTNWSNIPTNILTGMTYRTNFVSQTNYLWERLTAFDSGITFTNLGIGNELYISNAVWTFTPSNAALLRVDLIDTWYRQTGTSSVDAAFFLWLEYQDQNGWAIQQNLFGTFDDLAAHMPDNPGSEGLFIFGDNTRISRSFVIQPKSGSTVTLTNFIINSIEAPEEAHGTNFCRVEISQAIPRVTTYLP